LFKTNKTKQFQTKPPPPGYLDPEPRESQPFRAATINGALHSSQGGGKQPKKPKQSKTQNNPKRPTSSNQNKIIPSHLTPPENKTSGVSNADKMLM